MGDTSEFPIGDRGKPYLAGVPDLDSRFVVGWAISAVNDRRLTLKALEMAVQRRCPENAVQLATHFGATVTGVTSAGNADLVRQSRGRQGD